MARFTDDSRERVRDAVDFVDLVNSRTELRKAGVRRYVGLCPFHEERSPSFGIDPVEKLYHCFGCGAGGDLFRFVMETESIGFGEALELLADRYNVQLERAEEDPRAAEKRERRDRLHALLERTAAYYVRLLWESDEAAGARAYLESRGLSEGVLREFRVGYSPSGWDRVSSASARAGFSAGELLAAGVAQRSQGGRLVDRFRGRLMFPWADARGRVTGFGARALEEGQQPKYLNSSEGEVFSKGRQVYGTHLARVECARSGSVVLVEGYTDVIALHQAGIRNTVGQMGTALTEGQAAELAKLAPTVLLCLDADSAGQKAMLRAAEVIRGAERRLEVRVVPLPAGSDPADAVAGQGADAMRSRLDEALPFAAWRVRRALDTGDLQSAEGRDRVLSEVGPIVRELGPSVLRQELVQLVAGRLGLSESLATEALGNGRGRVAASDVSRPPTARRALDTRERAENEFLALCLAFPGPGGERLRSERIHGLFSSALVRRAAAHLREHLDAPSAGLPPEDEALSILIAELVVRAGALEEAHPSELDRAELMLELARLDRDIAAARVAQNPVSDLAAERQRVLGELRRLAAR